MLENLKEMLSGRIERYKLIEDVNKNPAAFENIVKLSLSDDENLAWRATWIIKQVIDKKDKRINPYVKNYLEIIANRKEGHQREILKILENADVDEELEGYLFDICLTIWEQVDKIPSVRINAFRIIVDIAKQYPEMKNEIEFLTGKIYYETLSSGIRQSFFRIKKEIFDSN